MPRVVGTKVQYHSTSVPCHILPACTPLIELFLLLRPIIHTDHERGRTDSAASVVLATPSVKHSAPPESLASVH